MHLFIQLNLSVRITSFKAILLYIDVRIQNTPALHSLLGNS